MQNDAIASYSAKVRLRLEHAGGIVPLAQVAPDWIIPAQPCEVPPGEADVDVEVDGHEHRRRVHLDQGISNSREPVPISTRATANPRKLQ